MNERELKINQLAQSIITFDEGLRWFDEASPADRVSIMGTLNMCVRQSHPTREEIEEGIARSGLKTTYSPCVLIRKKPLNLVLQKILDMPENDQRRGFILLVSVFARADERRRETQCKGGCSHEWHNIAL